MKYMLLIYSDPTREPAYGSPEFNAMMQGYSAFNETAGKAGVLKGGHGLQDIETATSVRVRSGKSEIMDGPFAETKERLGGYYILDCESLDDALRYAAMVPSAAYGTVEVRPLAEYGV
ncbi:MAG: YciI family protein [Beijerinckiaceae bacterium]